MYCYDEFSDTPLVRLEMVDITAMKNAKRNSIIFLCFNVNNYFAVFFLKYYYRSVDILLKSK